jgi:hypothetical protein
MCVIFNKTWRIEDIQLGEERDSKCKSGKGEGRLCRSNDHENEEFQSSSAVGGATSC